MRILVLILFALLLFACDDDQQEFEQRYSEFDDSITEVFFRSGKSYYFSYSVSVKKTRSGGAILEYDDHNHFDYEKLYKVELSQKEWQAFISDLYRVRTDEWQENLPVYDDDNDKEEVKKKKKVADKTALAKYLRKKYKAFVNMMFPPEDEWEFSIRHIDSYKNRRFSHKNKKPANWNELKMVMDRVSARAVALKEDTDNVIRAEYEKRFGEPISDFELLLRGAEMPVRNLDNVKVYRALQGAVAWYMGRRLELSLREWLDFARALRKFTKQWKDDRIIKWWLGYKWHMSVFTLDSNSFSFELNPPNMSEFKKAGDYENYDFDNESDINYGANAFPLNYIDYSNMVNDLIKRICKAPFVEFEDKLAAAYMEKFGEEISEFERSLQEVELDTWGKTYIVRASSYGNRGFMGYSLFKKPIVSVSKEVSWDEWLDFIRQLRRLRFDEWLPKYRVSDWGKVNSKEGKLRWDVNLKISGADFSQNCIDGNEWLAGYYDTDPPPNWKEFKALMDGIKKKSIESK